MVKQDRSGTELKLLSVTVPQDKPSCSLLFEMLIQCCLGFLWVSRFFDRRNSWRSRWRGGICLIEVGARETLGDTAGENRGARPRQTYDRCLLHLGKTSAFFLLFIQHWERIVLADDALGLHLQSKRGPGRLVNVLCHNISHLIVSVLPSEVPKRQQPCSAAHFVRHVT